MNVIIYFDEDGGDSKCHGATTLMCVDGRVHLKLSQWHTDRGAFRDSDGKIHGAFTTETYSIIGPCDATCNRNSRTIPVQAEELVKEFLVSGKCGEVEKTIEDYPSEFSWE